MSTLDELRQRINEMDLNILALLNQRAELALEIGKCKAALGSEDLYVPSREAEVLNRLCKVSQGPLPDSDIEAIYKQIMAACLQLQRDNHQG